jgi:hypothetical protein
MKVRQLLYMYNKKTQRHCKWWALISQVLLSLYHALVAISLNNLIFLINWQIKLTDKLIDKPINKHIDKHIDKHIEKPLYMDKCIMQNKESRWFLKALHSFWSSKGLNLSSYNISKRFFPWANDSLLFWFKHASIQYIIF